MGPLHPICQALAVAAASRACGTIGSAIPFTPTPLGLRLTVRLTPGASRTGIDGVVQLSDGRSALKIRVAARPIEGGANLGLIGYLSDALGLRKSSISIVSGAHSRIKLIELEGDTAALTSRLNALIEG